MKDLDRFRCAIADDACNNVWNFPAIDVMDPEVFGPERVRKALEDVGRGATFDAVWASLRKRVRGWDGLDGPPYPEGHWMHRNTENNSRFSSNSIGLRSKGVLR